MPALSPIGLQWGHGIRQIVTDTITHKSANVIPVAAHVDTSSGYGIYSSLIISELIRLNYEVELRPISWNETGIPLPTIVKSAITKSPNLNAWEFLIYPCVIQPASYKTYQRRTAYLTMWESTRLSGNPSLTYANAVQNMNQCAVVLTPSAWNASVFSACGVNTPIRVVPLGIDTSRFLFQDNPLDGPCVFGTAGRVAGGGTRKGFSTVLLAFQKAFPRQLDVRLLVKGFPDDPRLPEMDPRVTMTYKHLSTDELTQWYRSINVFVSGSQSEGWGLHQQEAMRCGRPVIGVNFGGVCEFFNEANGFPVDWKLVAGSGMYKGMGHYAEPSIDSMASQMRRCYEDRELVRSKGKLSSASASRFTIGHSADRILAVLREFEFIK